MIAIYDHLVAVLVGSVILLLLFNVSQRVQHASVERTMLYMTKSSTLDLGSYLQRDLMNAGFDTAPIETGILKHNTDAEGECVKRALQGKNRGMRIHYGKIGVQDVAYAFVKSRGRISKDESNY